MASFIVSLKILHTKNIAYFYASLKIFYKYVRNCSISLQSRTLLPGNNKSGHSVKFYKARLSRPSTLLKFTEISNVPPRTSEKKSDQFSVSKVHGTRECNNRIVTFAISRLHLLQRAAYLTRSIFLSIANAQKKDYKIKIRESCRCDKLKFAYKSVPSGAFLGQIIAITCDIQGIVAINPRLLFAANSIE